MEVKLYFICVFINSIADSLTEAHSTPIVTLSNGAKIQGRELKSHKNNSFLAFQEIPYGIPPTGDLRFKEPVEIQPWNGILTTVENTKVCMKLSENDPRETEDCLYLNVYTPKIRNCGGSPLPVYVYIYGGRFIKGDGTHESHGPELFMDYRIILVTINFRSGAFGFLSTEDEVIPGNLGLRDQQLALEWVQKNIQAFGGDPKKVTIGGQSSGACCVGYHLLNPKSQALFRGAIQQSGSPLISKMFMRHPRYFAFQLGNSINPDLKENNSSLELLKVLQNASTADIKKHSILAIPENLRNSVGYEANTVWNPVEEFSENGFVRGHMHENFRNGLFHRVPTLIGFTSEEELAFDLEGLKLEAGYFDRNDTNLINGNLNIKEENKYLAGAELKKIYTNQSFEEDFPALVQFISDAKYTTGICRQVELQSQYTNVFFYQFSYDGILGGINISIPGLTGVGHTEDVRYLFLNAGNRNINQFPKSDLEVSQELLTLWTNFIKYLNPMPFNPETPEYKWPVVTEDSKLVYQNISKTLQLASNPRKYQNIKEIYEKYAEKEQYTF